MDVGNGQGKENYRREEVALPNGEIVLAGDLTLPKEEGPYPAVVLISGTEGQWRNYNIRNFKMFDVLAEHLVRSGIAVLRFDTRGVRSCTGDVVETTILDRAGDVMTGMNFLKSLGDISDERIGLIGHWAGGNVASIVANETDDVAYVVLLAPPAMPGGEWLRQILQREHEIKGGSAEKIQQERAELELILQAAETGQGWEEVEAMLRRRAVELINDDYSSLLRESLEDIDQWVESKVAAELAGYRSPWFKSYAEYDPSPAVKAMDVPVLALFAELDWFAPPSINLVPFSEAIAQSSVPSHTILTIKTNERFQVLPRLGMPKRSPFPKLDFEPEFLEILLGWLAEQNGSP